jgi:hypothetical protein
MWFHWFKKEEPTTVKRASPYTSIRGANWFIENDKSYEIIEQQCVPGTEIISIRTLAKPTDWVGQAYLETTEGVMKILKEDGQGIWFWKNGWMGVHWFTKNGTWKEVEKWIQNNK